MKTIEVSPEWVLDKLSVTQKADGYGNITICSESKSDFQWIELALYTLGINYESCCVGCEIDLDAQYYEVEWKFRIEDVKEDCPDLYYKWSLMNDIKVPHLYGSQQSFDYELWKIKVLMLLKKINGINL